jgi:hypothetical protein
VKKVKKEKKMKKNPNANEWSRNMLLPQYPGLQPPEETQGLSVGTEALHQLLSVLLSHRELQQLL